VLDDLAPKSPAAAFPDDVLAIITVFSAHLYGARAHRPKPPPTPNSTLPILTRDCFMPPGTPSSSSAQVSSESPPAPAPQKRPVHAWTGHFHS
jgi:hypothetical protein